MLLLEAGDIINWAPLVLSGLDLALGALDVSMPGVDTPWEQNFADTVTGAIAGGQPAFDQFTLHLTGGTQPGQPPAPVSGGGGGGGGGGTPTGAIEYTAQLSISYTGGPGSPTTLDLQVEVDRA